MSEQEKKRQEREKAHPQQPYQLGTGQSHTQASVPIKINYSYKFLWRTEEDQGVGDQEAPQHQRGGKVAGPAGCWEVKWAFQELP